MSVATGAAFPFLRLCQHRSCPTRPFIDAALHFGDRPPITRKMLVDSGADSTLLTLPVALKLGMQPWQLRSGHSRLYDGVHTPVCLAPEGLAVGVWGFAAREVPSLVLESRVAWPFDLLGRRGFMGPLTVVFEKTRSGPRTMICEPEVPVLPRASGGPWGPPPLSPDHPTWGEGWASFPFQRTGPKEHARPLVPVRLWWEEGRPVDLTLLVDTGSPPTGVPLTAAHELGLPLERMPTRRGTRLDGSVHESVQGPGMALTAQVKGLPPFTVPIKVYEDLGPVGHPGKLGHLGLLDRFRVIFHHQGGVDRVTFLDIERYPPV